MLNSYTMATDDDERHTRCLSPSTHPLNPCLLESPSSVPLQGEYLFEPKWDGFRAIIFRSDDDIFIQSRDLKPLDRYFPELRKSHEWTLLPTACIVDGEIVIATPQGLDFDALQLRVHPAESRIKKLADTSPASFIAFDLLAAHGINVMHHRQDDRRSMLEALLGTAKAPLHLTPVTRLHSAATEWLQQFEGAGLDGVIAKSSDAPYLPGKRAMLKIKHARTADCVVAGFRWYKDTTDAVGSLLLGLYDDTGTLQHVGITSAFTMAARRDLARELAPLRDHALDDHPWRAWTSGRGTSNGSHAGRHAADGPVTRICRGKRCASNACAK